MLPQNVFVVKFSRVLLRLHNIRPEPAIDSEASDHFRCGIGYLADYRCGVLATVSWHGCRPMHFEIPFDGKQDPEHYAAAKVLKEGLYYFSRYPKGDANIHQDGLDRFGIRGSLLALPIGFLNSPTPFVIGALVLWTGGDALRADEAGLDAIKAEVSKMAKFTTLRIGPAVRAIPFVKSGPQM